MWASVQDGQGVFLWPNNNSLSQEFDLIDMGLVTYTSGRTYRYFQIRARHSGKCLMLNQAQAQAEGRVGNGTRIAQYACPGATYKSAQWSFRPMNGPCNDTAGVPAGNSVLGPQQCVDSGRRIIVNRYVATKCLDADNGSGKRPPQKAVLQLWTCISSTSAWNADNQIWKVLDRSTGRYVTQFG